MSIPDFVLQWSPTTGPFTTPDYVDMSDLLLSATTKRGRQYELDRPEAGTMTCIIEDQNRQFDPTNPYSPYYGGVKPLKQIQLGANWDSSFWPIFTGFITDYKIAWESPDVTEVELTIADGFEIFSNADIVSTFSSFTTSHGSNKDLVFTSTIPGAGGNYIVVNITSGSSLAVTVSGVEITVACGGAVTAYTLMTVLNEDPVAGQLITTTLAPGSSGAGLYPTSSVTLAGGVFVTQLTGSRMAAVCDNIGWPTAWRNLDPGTVEVIAQTYLVSDTEIALDHINDVENSGLSLFFMGADGYATFHEFEHRLIETRSTVSNGTFGDDAALTELEYIDLVPSYDDVHIYNVVSVTPVNSYTPVTATDATSVSEYGPRMFSVSSQIAGTEDAHSLSNYILNKYKEPAYRFSSMSIQPVEDDGLWAQAFGREISDRITVHRRPPDFSGETLTILEQDCFVEGISWNIQVGQDSQITFDLSPASGSGSGYYAVIITDDTSGFTLGTGQAL